MPPLLNSYLPQIRLETFLKKRRGASKALNWPFTSPTSSLNSEQISSAGFFHIPTNKEPLKTECYLCHLIISNWLEGEIIDERHLIESKECSLAIIRSESKELDTNLSNLISFPIIFDSLLNHPKSIRMSNARLGTFSIGWPWENELGLPTKEEISNAGWYFRPGKEEDENDQCVCYCCTRTVGGWEVGDDPIALHHKKQGLTCPFFTAPSISISNINSPPIPSTSSTTTINTKAPTSSKSNTSGSGSNNNKSKSKSSSKSKSKMIIEEEELEAEEEVIVDQVADEVVVVVVEEEIQIEPEPIQSTSTSKSTRSSRRVKPISEDDSTKVAPISKKSTRSTKNTPIPIVEEEIVPEAVVEVEEESIPIPIPELEVEVVPEVVPEVEEVPEVVEEVVEEALVEEEVIVPIKKGKNGAKVLKTKVGKGKKVVVEKEEEEIQKVEMEVEAEVAQVEEEKETEVDKMVEEEEEVEVIPIVEKVVVVEKEEEVSSKSRTSTKNKKNKKEKMEVEVEVEVIQKAAPTPIQAQVEVEVVESPIRIIKSLPNTTTNNKSKSTKSNKSTSSISITSPVLVTKVTKPVLKSSSSSSSNTTILADPIPITKKSNTKSTTTVLLPHLPRPSPFSTSSKENLIPTEEELNLTIEEYFNTCLEKDFNLLKFEMSTELKILEDRIGKAREWLVEMIGDN